MKSKQIFLILLVATFGLSCSILTYADSTNRTKELAVQAVAGNSKKAEFAITELRELGAQGLQTLFETYASDIENFKNSGESNEKWQKIAHALDSVAMQKDVYASKLFWYKNLAKAQAEAKRTNKPILSLRLLGNLNEEFSCANSRFFRAILYPNSQISSYLQQNYVLHWQSVRPAPKVTIDFGDGRKIERTITGNSIHYVLDKDGNVMDALAGLNNPNVFIQFLRTGQNLVQILGNYPNNEQAKTDALNQFRGQSYQVLTGQINWFGEQLNLQFDTTKKPTRNFEAMPPAITAMSVAVTKRSVEMPILKSVTTDVMRYGEEQINLENWKQIAKLSQIETELDQNSIDFIRRQTAKNNLTQEDFNNLITKLQEFIAIDTARNQYLLRPILLVWLAKGEDKNLVKLNEKIYSELFLTPSADKWLGLYAPDIYTALDGNGIK